ncbi:MAG: NADH-quinone oxidoreductase subunit N [Actinomycetota bacterium]
MQTIDYHAILAPMILSATILVVLVVDAFLPNRFKWFAMPLSLIGVVATLVADLTLVGETRSTFGGMYVVDNFTLLFQVFFLAVAIVVLALSLRYFREGGFYQGEYYFLLLTSFLGCVLMPASRDILMLFISLELVSAPGFLMSAFRKSDVKGNEGGIKFFIIGVLSTAVMLYGMSMIFGLTGATRLTDIATGLAKLSGAQLTLADASILFVVVGFAFKVSAVPFQFWAPDTYEGAPVPVAAFLAVASKAAGFAGLLQLMFVAFIGQAAYWTPLFAAISIATMTVGNLVALQQKQVVRLLAYSGIAQAGYMLLPFALAQTGNPSGNASAFSASVSYILIYGVMNIGAFAVATAVSRRHPRLLISDFDGLVKVAPLLAIGMTVFMISLAGIPPTGGFWAKLLVFQAAIERGGVGVWLAIVMLVNSVVSIAYYFAIPRAMLFNAPERNEALSSSWLVNAVVAVAVLALLAIFVLPQAVAHLGDLSTLGGAAVGG